MKPNLYDPTGNGFVISHVAYFIKTYADSKVGYIEVDNIT